MKYTSLSLAIAWLLVSASAVAQSSPDSWKAMDAALGRQGQMQPGDVYKFSMPRRDLHVTKDGVTIAPGFALGSWAAFKTMGNETMLMGDLVLTDDEIEPVMLKLQYQCEKEARQAGLPRSSFPVKYVAGAGKSVAIIPVNKQSVTLTSVAAASGAKYVAGPLTWREKGKSGTTVSEDLSTGKVSGTCRVVSTGDDLGPIVYPDIPNNRP